MPRAAHTIAKAIPVFPLVGSTTMVSGPMACMAASTAGVGAVARVGASLAPPNANGTRDVVLDIEPAKRNAYELGVGYSTTEGIGGEAEWTRRNISGRADSLIVSTTLSELAQGVDVELRRPHAAGLNHTVRYLASDLGPKGVRVNALSAGPMRTLAGSGVSDARVIFNYQRDHSPLRRTPTLDEVGGAGLYLLSDLSGAVTGEVHFVDCGYSVTSMPTLEALKELEADAAAAGRAVNKAAE